MTMAELTILDELKKVALTKDKAIRKVSTPVDIYGKIAPGYERCYQVLNARNEVLHTTDLPGLCLYFNHRISFDSFHKPIVNMTI